jgi:hypothetical protein
VRTIAAALPTVGLRRGTLGQAVLIQTAGPVLLGLVLAQHGHAVAADAEPRTFARFPA